MGLQEGHQTFSCELFLGGFVVKFCHYFVNSLFGFSWALIFDKFKLFKAVIPIEEFEKKFWKAKSAESFQ